MKKLGIKEALLQRVKNDYAEAEEGSSRKKMLGAMLVPLMAAPGMAMAGGGSTTGQQLLENIEDFARSPFMIAISIIAVILGVLMAIGGNIKAAFLPFGLAAIVAVGPWLVNEIFDAMASGL